MIPFSSLSLQWRHIGRDNVSNHQPHDYLLNRLFKRGSKKNQSSASLAFVGGGGGIYRWPVNSPHKGPVTRKMFPFWLRHHVELGCHRRYRITSSLAQVVALPQLRVKQLPQPINVNLCCIRLWEIFRTIILYTLNNFNQWNISDILSAKRRPFCRGRGQLLRAYLDQFGDNDQC